MKSIVLYGLWVLGLSRLLFAQTPTTWNGNIHLPGGAKLGLTLDLTPASAEAPASATISIPAQKVEKAPLADVTILATGEFTGIYKPEGVGENMWCRIRCVPFDSSAQALGHMKQMGQLFAMTCDRDLGEIARRMPAPIGPEEWRGVIHLPGGQTLAFTTRLERTPEMSLSATMSIPSQGLTDGKLHDFAANEETMAFTLKPDGAPERAWARFFAIRSADATTAMATMDQMGSKFAVEMERIVEGKASAILPKRPQTPQPPFPYQSREVEVVNDLSMFKLAGTLTISNAPGKHPAAILITGSGPQDRDETIFDHKPFLIIADHLTRQGIAILRLDDRGFGGSTGNHATATTQDFASDIAAALKFLRDQPEIDANRIGLIGHSEGGIIAPLVAATRPQDVKFMLLLAAPCIPGAELLKQQSDLMARAAGMKEEAIAVQNQAMPALLAMIERDADDQEIAAYIRAEGLKQAAAAGADPNSPETLAAVEAVVKAQTQMLTTPWMRWFIKYDPRPILKSITCPVLALNGSLDMQVPAQVNLSEIEKALKDAGNADVTTREFPGLNHLFQTAKTGALDEYAQIEETFAPAVLDAMTLWIRNHVGLGD